MNSHTFSNLSSLYPKKIHALFQLSQMITNKEYYCHYAKNKLLIQAFFEPSTRTSLSFECAMKKLGGHVVHFNPDISSKQKGENDMDTLMTLQQYGDALVLRHPEPNVFHDAIKQLHIPIINGGNGAGDHPTQALLDLYTTYKKFGNDFQEKTYLFVGDIYNSRTIHSFIKLLELYPLTKIHLFPYVGCEPSESYVEQIAQIHKQNKEEVVVPREHMYYGDYDVVYLTRFQTERHNTAYTSYQPNESQSDTSQSENDESQNDTSQSESEESDSDYSQPPENFETSSLFETPYCFTAKEANEMSHDAIILHPFPRNNELHPNVDNTPQAYYFQQMQYGIELRMAILETMFKEIALKKSSSTKNYIINAFKYKTTTKHMIIKSVQLSMMLCNIVNVSTFLSNVQLTHICFMIVIYVFVDLISYLNMIYIY